MNLYSIPLSQAIIINIDDLKTDKYENFEYSENLSFTNSIIAKMVTVK